MKKKTILFLSALDFTEKAIQVIKKTPEAYYEQGWNVLYIVYRNNSKYGNSFYEREVNPEGVKVYRFYYNSYLDKIKNQLLRTIGLKINGYLIILDIALQATKILKNSEVQIIYGYEYHGVLAANLLRVIGFTKNIKIISRFQGTYYLTNYINTKNYLKLLLNWEHLLALYLPSDLCIMTNDGTQGDKTLKFIHSKNLLNFRFWINGVDEQKICEKQIDKIQINLNLNKNNQFICLSVSRLVKCKRIDRGITAFAKLIHQYNFQNCQYWILGEGVERNNLENLVETLNVKDYVLFFGAVKNEDVKNYLNLADIFISTYDVSNVGNPLLEAIRANKIIFTLNNGDTGNWIKHGYNGFIYDIDSAFADQMAKDMYEVTINENLRNQIISNIKLTEQEKLWTWKMRLNSEIKEVESLLYDHNN